MIYTADSLIDASMNYWEIIFHIELYVLYGRVPDSVVCAESVNSFKSTIKILVYAWLCNLYDYRGDPLILAQN